MPLLLREPMFVNSDFTDLLKLFNDNHVKYLVIGGYAVVQHAEPRYTKDLDLWINADAVNAEAVYKALREFGAPLAELTEKDFAEEGYFYQMGVPPVRVDILMGIPGIEFDGGDAVTAQQSTSVKLFILTQFRNVVPVATPNRFQLLTRPFCEGASLFSWVCHTVP
jgi:hypothetical protein